MKPHIALMALVVWLFTARRLAGEQSRPWRAAAADLFGNLLGGLTVGLLGVSWMVATDTWEPFRVVFEYWNPLYIKLARHEFRWRVEQELYWFPPWSMWILVTAPLALASVLDMAPWQSRTGASARPTSWFGRWLPRHLWDKQAGADARFVRGAIGILYLVWAFQAFVVQRGFQYAHVPETLLMIALWAMHRWAWVPIVLVWITVISGVWVVAEYRPDTRAWLDRVHPKTRKQYLPRHPITDPDRLRLWPDCWRFGMSDAERYVLWDELRLHPIHEASIGWDELNEVAEFLRTAPRPDGGVGVRDREVIAWYDSPHAVYLMLDIEPAFRYMHVYTALSIIADEPVNIVMKELHEEPRCRKYMYVICDLEWVALAAEDDPPHRAHLVGKARNPPYDLLPAVTPYPSEFPFNQPTIYRTRGGTGRYIVHRVMYLDNGPQIPLFWAQVAVPLMRQLSHPHCALPAPPNP